MTNTPQALLLADVSPYLENSEKSQWIMSAATELRRLDQLAMDQHTEIYGLLALCRRALRALDEDSYPQLRDDLRKAIDKAEAA